MSNHLCNAMQCNVWLSGSFIHFCWQTLRGVSVVWEDRSNCSTVSNQSEASDATKHLHFSWLKISRDFHFCFDFFYFSSKSQLNSIRLLELAAHRLLCEHILSTTAYYCLSLISFGVFPLKIPARPYPIIFLVEIISVRSKNFQI